MRQSSIEIAKALALVSAITSLLNARDFKCDEKSSVEQCKAKFNEQFQAIFKDLYLKFYANALTEHTEVFKQIIKDMPKNADLTGLLKENLNTITVTAPEVLKLNDLKFEPKNYKKISKLLEDAFDRWKQYTVGPQVTKKLQELLIKYKYQENLRILSALFQNEVAFLFKTMYTNLSQNFLKKEPIYTEVYEFSKKIKRAKGNEKFSLYQELKEMLGTKLDMDFVDSVVYLA